MQTKHSNRTSFLNRSIYLEARKMVLPQFKDDTEEVKAMRDRYTQSMFGKQYDELTSSELQRVYDRLRWINSEKRASGKLPEIKKMAIDGRASKSQIARVRYLALWFAIEYDSMEDISFVNQKTGEIYEGENMREILRWALEKNSCANMYFTHINLLYKRTANPKCNDILLNAGLKLRVLAPEKFYYESMKQKEAQQIIKQLELMKEAKNMTQTKWASNRNEKHIMEHNLSLN